MNTVQSKGENKGKDSGEKNQSLDGKNKGKDDSKGKGKEGKSEPRQYFNSDKGC